MISLINPLLCSFLTCTLAFTLTENTLWEHDGSSATPDPLLHLQAVYFWTCRYICLTQLIFCTQNISFSQRVEHRKLQLKVIGFKRAFVPTGSFMLSTLMVLWGVQGVDCLAPCNMIWSVCVRVCMCFIYMYTPIFTIYRVVLIHWRAWNIETPVWCNATQQLCNKCNFA